MFRFNRVVCALAVCGLVGAAMAAAVKIKSFDTAMGDEEANADGMAILNYAAGQDETVIQIAMSDFKPNTNYLFTLVSPSHCLQPGGGIITDDHGHATFHGVIGAVPAVGDCPAEGGDWSDSDIIFDVQGVTKAVAWNPN